MVGSLPLVTLTSPSMRHTMSLSLAALPQTSVPRIPAVTLAIRTSSLRRWLRESSVVVNRKAPLTTSSRPSNRPPVLAGLSAWSLSSASAPSLTRLPSASWTSSRALGPVRSMSPASSAMPGATGSLVPPRCTHAGTWTLWTRAAGAAATVGGTTASRASTSSSECAASAAGRLPEVGSVILAGDPISMPSRWLGEVATSIAVRNLPPGARVGIAG